MNIGFNLLYLIPNKVGGTERYARGIIAFIEKELRSNDRVFLFCNKENAQTFKNTEQIKIIRLPVQAENRAIRLLYEQLCLWFFVKKYKIDVLHSLGYVCPFWVPAKNIVTIHDLNWYYHPEDFSFLQRMFWKFFVIGSATFSDHIVTVSQASKDSFVENLHISPKKISIIHSGLYFPAVSNTSWSSFKRKYSIRIRYLLSVTSMVPHKNVPKLLEAFRLVLKKDPTLQLVIVGLGGKQKATIEKALEKFPPNSVIVPGWVSEDELQHLYRNAICFVFVSLYEGFGFPVLEAFYYKLPVISSDSFSLAEIIDGAAQKVNPHSAQDISIKILRVINSPKQQKLLAEKGYKKVKYFNFEIAVKQLIQLYKK